jgi:trehalose/maltose transport system permease protein
MAATAGGAQQPKFEKPRSQWGKARERLAWILVLPSLLIIFGVAFWPLVNSFYISFTNTSMTKPEQPLLGWIWHSISTFSLDAPNRWVGLNNYRKIFADDVFIQAIRTTVLFTVVSVFFETLFGTIIALTINSSFRGRGLVRTSMLIPWAIPTIVSAQMWAWMYNDVYGVFNDLLVKRLGILNEPIAWIGPAYDNAIWSIIAIDIWKTTPFMTLLILAGLQVIPGDVYEASTVDGASKWQQFWQITLPLVKPALVVALIFRTLDAFRVFDVIQVTMAYATRTMSVAVYAQQQFSQNRGGFGMTAATSVFILVVIMALVVVYTKLIKAEEM